MGKVSSLPALLLGRKKPTGLPQGHWDPGIPPVISTLPPHPTPVLGASSGLSPLRGSAGASSFSSSPSKGAGHLSILTPSLGCPERLYISIRHSILVPSQSVLPSFEAANQSPRLGKPTQVGVLLDLSRLAHGWLLWSLRVKHYVNLFCDFSKTLLLGVTLGSDLPSPMGKSHMLRQNWVEEIHNSPYSHVITFPRPCSHPVAPPRSPLKLPFSGWGCVPSDGSSS